MFYFMLFQETKSNNKTNSFNETEPEKDIEQPVIVIKEAETPANVEVNFDEPDKASTSNDADDSMEETVNEILKLMPKDFFDFWKFCSSVNKSKPEGMITLKLKVAISLMTLLNLLLKYTTYQLFPHFTRILLKIVIF